MKKSILYILIIASLLLGMVTSTPLVQAQDTEQDLVNSLKTALDNDDLLKADELGKEMLVKYGYKDVKIPEVNYFLDNQRRHLVSKIQNEVVAELGPDGLDGILNTGSHARPDNPKYVVGKSDKDITFVGKKSKDAEALFKQKLTAELGEDASSKLKVSAFNDESFKKLKRVQELEEAYKTNKITFLDLMSNPEYKEYYKTTGGQKLVEKLTFGEGTFDKVSTDLNNRAIIVRDDAAVTKIGEPTEAMKELYIKQGWTPPEKINLGDAWGVTSNEYYFYNETLNELADKDAVTKAAAIAKRAERLEEALAPLNEELPEDFMDTVNKLRRGEKISGEAAEQFLKETDELMGKTLEKTFKQRVNIDLTSQLIQEAAEGKTGEELTASIKNVIQKQYAETVKGMVLLPEDKVRQILDNARSGMPEILRESFDKRYNRIIAQRQIITEAIDANTTKLSASTVKNLNKMGAEIASEAEKGASVISAIEKSGEPGAVNKFLGSTAGKIINPIDLGFRYLSVYDAYKEGGAQRAGVRAALELGAYGLSKSYAIETGNLALAALDIGTIIPKMVAESKIEDLRDDNVNGILTGVNPARESGSISIGRGDVERNTGSIFGSLGITGLTDEQKELIKSSLSKDPNYQKFVAENSSYVSRLRDPQLRQRSEELKDIYVSKLNSQVMRLQVYDSVKNEFEAKEAEWTKEHGLSTYDAKERDELIKSFLRQKLDKFKADYPEAISNYWLEKDKTLWDRIEQQLLADFKKSYDVSYERDRRQMAVENYIADTNKAKEDFNKQQEEQQKKVDPYSGVDAKTRQKIKAYFPETTAAATKPGETPSTGIDISVSPDVVGPGETVSIRAEVQPPQQKTLTITIQNSLSGESWWTGRVPTGADGVYNKSILITAEKLKDWRGPNVVTVEGEGVSGSSVFTVLDFSASVAPSQLTPGAKAKLKIAIVPARQMQLKVSIDNKPDSSPFTTDAEGALSLDLNLDPQIAEGKHLVNVKLMDGTIVCSASFTVINASVLVTVTPNTIKPGDKFTVKTEVVPPQETDIVVHILNNDFGPYATNKEGKHTLNLTLGADVQSSGEQEAVVEAKTLGLSGTTNFTIAPSQLFVELTPSQVAPGESLTISITVVPAQATTVTISGLQGSWSTTPKGTLVTSIPISSQAAPGPYKVTVTAPSLGVSGSANFTIVGTGPVPTPPTPPGPTGDLAKVKWCMVGFILPGTYSVEGETQESAVMLLNTEWSEQAGKLAGKFEGNVFKGSTKVQESGNTFEAQVQVTLDASGTKVSSFRYIWKEKFYASDTSITTNGDMTGSELVKEAEGDQQIWYSVSGAEACKRMRVSHSMVGANTATLISLECDPYDENKVTIVFGW